jgi:hypothetical protein
MLNFNSILISIQTDPKRFLVKIVETQTFLDL